VPTQRPTTIRLRASLLEEANAIVERDFASDLSLDDIARRVASSRRQLQRAYELLETRALTVREVAHRVGYRQPAQFAKAFRRHRGVAPSDYRASNGTLQSRAA
jgi:AraC family transcriptional regulator, regulatory protein of adaptative response / methylphosphotriester-DNA alkyltransferase methyltransferase